MKWEAVAAMALLLALGFWLARAPDVKGLRPQSVTQDIVIGGEKGVLERHHEVDGSYTFRLIFRDGSASPVMSESELGNIVTPRVAEKLAKAGDSLVFRWLHITSWPSVAWVMLGFLGQFAFTGRMLLQWFVSEKRKESVVTIGFWVMSFIGGVMLFTYFIWRQDIVGVLGQSTGVVIYARNIRLYYKKAKREARVAEKQRARGLSAENGAGLAPEPKPGAVSSPESGSR